MGVLFYLNVLLSVEGEFVYFAECFFQVISSSFEAELWEMLVPLDQDCQ